jgi:hypothetical protein
MAAGLGFIEFTTGDVLTAAAANGYLASQVVMVFADAAARTTAITSPQEGMISFLKDTNAVEAYDGAAWVGIGGGSSPLTTKGDLYTFDTADARLGVGANGTVLTADSVEATGLKWVAPAAGGGLTLISSTTLSGTSTTISSIPGTYKYLKMIIDGAYLGSGAANEVRIRFNSDTGNNYADSRLSVSASTFNGDAAINQSANSLGYSLGVSSAAQQKFYGNFEIQNYTATSGGVSFRGGSSSYVNSTHSGSFMNNSYNNSAAITSITFLAIGGASFAAGTVSLYGVN